MYVCIGRATQVHQDRMIISGFTMYVWAESLEATAVDRHSDMICFKFNEAATTVGIRMVSVCMVFICLYCMYVCMYVCMYAFI